METLLDQFVTFADHNAELAYALLFLSAFVENVFPPIPGDTITLLGAYFVGRGSLSFTGVLISTTLGSVVGFMTLFALAYWLGWEFFERKRWKWVNAEALDRVDRWFQKYGYGIIFANRFLSGIRSVISLSAGLSKLRPLRVTLLATASAFLWNGIIIYAGAFIGRSWQEIQEYIRLYNRVLLIALGVALVSYLLYRWWRKAKRVGA
ncbi:MAG: DedA family protein [Calditrichaeota bacterium]|nr:MAG: DedA family protein [Calditrichota bacterium]